MVVLIDFNYIFKIRIRISNYLKINKYNKKIKK